MRKVFYIYILLFILLAACGGSPTVQSSLATPSQPATAEVVKTEIPQVQAVTSLPSVPPASPATPSGPAPTVITTIPAPDADTGVVTGSVFSTVINAPLSSVGVYLGEYMYMTPGPDYMVTIREKGSPHTLADANGRFVIDKVPPGKYPLLVWTPFNSKVIPDTEGKKELVVTVEAGKVTDLGEIRTDFP